MRFRFSPRQRRNILRIIPFGIIWLMLSWVFLANDLILTRNQNLNPDTDITLSVPVLIAANVMILVAGLLMGTVEVVVLAKSFKGYSLGRKVLLKFLAYTGCLLLIIAIAYPIAASIEAATSILSAEIWSKTGRFFVSLTFLNTLIQLSFSLLISLIYSAVAENVGQNVFRNFFTGRYHNPRFERRIFMFLDMKDSTPIAERLGHVTYFSFLRDYYSMMSDPIIDHLGEVYQYIGDEVVISWREEAGLYRDNCVNVFRAIQKERDKRRDAFLKKYGEVPDFKAGVHMGEVTVGEIGALKKEIAFSGDVLNTTSRIQSICKEYGEDLIMSDALRESLSPEKQRSAEFLGELRLKGKSVATQIFAVR